MIPHDEHSRPRLIRDAASYLKIILAALGVPKLGFRQTPDLGCYKLACEVPQRADVVPFLVPVRYRGTDSSGRPKRVDPASERRRLAR